MISAYICTPGAQIALVTTLVATSVREFDEPSAESVQLLSGTSDRLQIEFGWSRHECFNIKVENPPRIGMMVKKRRTSDIGSSLAFYILVLSNERGLHCPSSFTFGI